MKLQLFQTSGAGTLIGLALSIMTGALCHAETIGIHFLGNATAQTVTNAAGVVAITNWNNIANTSFTSGAIYSSDNSGSLTLAMSGSGAHNGWNSGVTGDGANASILRGYCDAGINNPVTNIISGLTGASYTVYIYCEGDSKRPSNGGDWLPNYSVNGISYYTATVNGTAGLQQGGVALSNTNTYPPAITYGDYIEVDNVTPVSGSIAISANSDNRSWRSPLNGIEIVPSTVVAPSIQAQTASLTNYAGSTVQLSVIASGSPLNYQWQAGSVGSGIYTNLVNGGTISGATSATLTLSNVNLGNTADYVVVITNAAGVVTSAVPITVDIVTMLISDPSPSSAVLYPGGGARFAVNVTGYAPLTYHWQKNGAFVADGGHVFGSATNALVISNAAIADSGSFDLVITNVYGAVTSSPALLGIVSSPVTGSYAQNLFAKGPVAYWRLNETAGTNGYDYAGGHTANYGIYTTLGVSGSGPSGSSWPGFETTNAAIQVYHGILGSQVEVPASEALNLNTNTVTLISWIYPVSTPQPNEGLVFQRGSGGVAGLNIGGSGNLGYNWNNDGSTWNWDSGLAPAVGQWSFVALVVTPTNATIYMFNTNGQSSATLTHNHANASFAGQIDIGDDPVFGDGSRIFDGYIGEVAVFKQSLANADIVQLYSIASGSLVAPSISLQPQSQAVFAGTNVQFTVSAAGTLPLAYQWLENGTNLANGSGISGATTPGLIINAASILNAGDYSVIITNQAGAVTSSVASLFILNPTNFNQGVIGLAPLGYWRLNESSSTIAADSSGNGFNGTYQPAATLGVPGVQYPPYAGFDSSNLAVSLDGQTNSWVSLPGLNLNSANVTFTAWIYPTNSQAGSAGIVFCRDGQGTTSGFGYNTSGTQLGYTWNDDGGTYGWNSGLVPPANRWSFVALVVTPTNAAVYMYNTNGLLSASVDHAHAASAFAGEARIGNDSYSPARTFQGSLDEVAVFNTSLNFAKIRQLYVDGSIGNGTTPAVTLSIQQSGTNLMLTWNQGTLLESTNLLGPWTTNNAATSPYSVIPSSPQKFYRMLVQ